MPFPSTLSAGQLTQVRKTTQSFRQFLVLCPNNIIWQTQPDENISNEVYAEFDWTGTLQGDIDDVKEGMTVLITTSASDLLTVVFRGRVRVAPDADTFYINETSATITTAYYVTVLDDWDIHERLERRTVADVAFKDWDLPFTTSPPLITGLQSVYADTSGTATVNFVFTATADPTADGATISTYLWYEADGTINSGQGTATLDVTFPGAVTNEQRWVLLVVTDSNAVNSYFAFEVYTVDLADTSTNVIALDTGDVSLTGTIDDGFNITVRAWDGFTGALDRTRCALVTVDDYDGTATPITQNVSFVGRLRQEGNFTTGDERFGVLQDTRLTIEGFVSQLGRLHGAGLYLTNDTSPTTWGEIDTLTIKRALVFMLAWHSTYLNVSGVTFDTDSDLYEWPEFVVQESSLLEWVNSVADDQNAQLVTSADGQSTFQRDARIGGVGGLDTITVFTTADMLDYTLDIETIPTHSQAIIGAATYNTSANSAVVYVGRAPAQAFSPGWETAPLNQQIMKSDLSDADAKTEVGTRVANYLATVNPRPRLNAQFMPGFYWGVPSFHQLWAFNIAATDNTRGRAYTDADKWLWLEITYGYNPITGTYEPVSGVFELIVAGGASGIVVTQVPDVNDLRLPILPGIGAGFNPVIDPLINYPIDDPDFDLPGIDAGITQPGPWTPQPGVNCEALNVSMKSGSIVTTSESTVFGETYNVNVQGDAQVDQATGWEHTITTDNGFVDFTLLIGVAESYRVKATQSGADRILQTETNFGAVGTVTTVVVNGRFDTKANTRQLRLEGYNGVSLDYTSTKSLPGYPTGSFDYTFNLGGIALDKIDVRWLASVAGTIGFAGMYYIVISGTGTNPFTGGGGTAKRGDAFYYGYDVGTTELYPGSNGFQIDSARPAGIPGYASSHSYSFTTVGTGSPLGFRFLDSDYSDNDNNQLAVTICGSGMKQG